MLLLAFSFIAWVLTILAPCVLPILPIILWASLEESKDKSKPYIVISSLLLSIIIFSLLLKASTLFIWVNPIFWKLLSWVILIVFWIITMFPSIWKRVSSSFQDKSNKNLFSSSQKKWVLWSVLIWASLWPVFSSCSPTYALILSVILPISFFSWFINLISYSLWLWAMLLAISILGQKFVWKLRWASSPDWIFKKVLWFLFLLIWLFIVFWIDKIIESKLLDSWYLDSTVNLEQKILDRIDINN